MVNILNTPKNEKHIPYLDTYFTTLISFMSIQKNYDLHFISKLLYPKRSSKQPKNSEKICII